VTVFQTASSSLECCCYSPDGRLVAIAGGNTAYIWDVTSSGPYLVETFIGHTNGITSLAFSSSTTLISISEDKSIKFWQIGTPSMDLTVTGPKSASLTSTPVRSITLQAKDGIATTTHSDGMVKTWDISTGLCKASFQTPAKESHLRDVQLISGRLTFVWYTNGKIHVWDVERGKFLLEIDGPDYSADLKISGDGSRIFSLNALPYLKQYIYAWSVQTGEVMRQGGGWPPQLCGIPHC
jgi:WD40 repeat protein